MPLQLLERIPASATANIPSLRRSAPSGGSRVPIMNSNTAYPWCRRGVRSTLVNACGLEVITRRREDEEVVVLCKEIGRLSTAGAGQ